MTEQNESQGFRSGRGGHRPGAGRKSGWNHSETQMIRVPKVFAQQLLEIAHRLDEGKVIDSESKSISSTREELETVVNTILNDQSVTRMGKDKGAIRRGLEALINRL